MKRASFILGLLISLTLKSQIVLENSYPALTGYNYMQVSIVRLSSGYKYTRYNPSTAQVLLYNINHSLWKTIPMSVPTGYTLYVGGQYISDSLFKLDPAVELAYSYYKTTTTTPVSYTTTTKIIDETGVTILTLNQCMAPIQVVSAGSNGYKMIASIDTVGKPYWSSGKETLVYSLPGRLPQNNTTPTSSTTTGGTNTITTIVNAISTGNDPYLSNPTPNPSAGKSTIAYQLPNNMAQGEILIYDMSGREVKRYTVDKAFNTLELDSTELPAGNYLYQMTGVDQAKRLIVIH